VAFDGSSCGNEFVRGPERAEGNVTLRGGILGDRDVVIPWNTRLEVRLMATLPTIIPISDLRQDAAGVVKRAVASDRPVVITQRGRATAVLVSAEAYDRVQYENELLRALARGDAEIAVGDGRDAVDVMAEARALLAGE
jgi:prevent-host-death family protein